MRDDPDAMASALSIVAVPKKFLGHTAIIQDNAIRSWKALPIAREVVLFASEAGVAEAADALGVRHHSDIQCDPWGTPLLDDVFRQARDRTEAEWLCYVNADIILLPDFAHAVRNVVSTLGRCLIVSRRWNLDVRARLPFNPGWTDTLRERAARHAELFTSWGIDVFVFPRDLFTSVPPFSLGRASWDNWIIAEARRRGYPVVDVTTPYTVIHQNHSYDRFASVEHIRRSQQGLRNFWLAGDSHRVLASVDDATHRLQAGDVVAAAATKVSVVITHASDIRSLRECLLAVTRQRYPRTYVETIVVDYSATESSAVVEREFPGVRVTGERTRGRPAARNKGAAIAGGDLIAFVDSACRPHPGWLKAAVEAAEQARLSSVVMCGVTPAIDRTRSAGVQAYGAITFEWPSSSVASDRGCDAAVVVVPTVVWLTTGPFDEGFGDAGGCDWEWCERAKASGFAITVATHARVAYPIPATWRDLRVHCRRKARGALRLETIQSGRATAAAALGLRQLRQCARAIQAALSSPVVPAHGRLSTALAAIVGWCWMRGELRRQSARDGNATASVPLTAAR